MSWDEIYHLSSPALITIVIMTIMFGVKRIPHIPNDAIPWLAMLLGVLLYPWVDSHDVKQNHAEDWSPRKFLVGLLIGAAGVGIHQGFNSINDRRKNTRDNDILDEAVRTNTVTPEIKKIAIKQELEKALVDLKAEAKEPKP